MDRVIKKKEKLFFKSIRTCVTVIRLVDLVVVYISVTRNLKKKKTIQHILLTARCMTLSVLETCY